MEIHQLSATKLLELLGSGILSSVEIVRALHERADAVDGRVHAYVLRRRAESLAEAEEADRARSAGERRGPLHGLPITIKDNLDLTGTDSTLGLRSRVGKPAASDAVVVRLLREAGAIILGKTNVPQLLLAQESENAVFGATNNPWNLQRVPGGSSGGEAAAVASGMSPLGVGTDIGGSIRIPAHFCGIAGMKPTLDRWSNRGSSTAIPGQEVVRAQIGPMAREVEDLSLLFRVLEPRRQSALDPAVSTVPFTEPDKVDLRGLRIGYFTDDGFLAPVASVARAVEQARQALVDAGATVIHHAPAGAEDLIYVWLGAISSDGGRTLTRALAGEKISPQLKPSLLSLRLPGPVRQTAARLAQVMGERRVSRLLRTLGEKSVTELWQLTQRRTELRWAEFDAWNRAQLDAVICPPHVVPALGHRQSGDYTLSVSNAFRWSLLNFPAGIVPVTRVRGDEAAAAAPAGGDRIDKKTARIASESAGLPVGVQVVARPYREEVALAVMKVIETYARNEPDYPRTPVDP